MTFCFWSIYLESPITNCSKSNIVNLNKNFSKANKSLCFILIRQSNADYSQFLNDYPGRFKIAYASPDDVNALCFKSNLVHYDTSVTNRPTRYAVNYNKKIIRYIFFII